MTKNQLSKYNVFHLIYNSWVENILEDDSPLLGVHALRNFIRGNSTFISSLFILLGILVGFYHYPLSVF
ncbi:MAG: hypothetical protein BAJALOKI1v1_10015 [Promethearchaeota archaeon]|nr:MAG: hypothetical protein BAJALOKI1v1_10015 [Candidatus Lokiarchaeota archaeon]